MSANDTKPATATATATATIKPVTITSGNIPIGREKEPEKKDCACGGKGCNTTHKDSATK